MQKLSCIALISCHTGCKEGEKGDGHDGICGLAIRQAMTRMMFCAGTLFWKWALSPKNPRTDYLEVAVPDPTFTDIVAPGAKTALDWAKKSSPAQNCQKVRNAECPLIHSISFAQQSP